jgi:hypothetical protein
MNKLSPNGTQTYTANQRKTFHSVLCHLLQTEFPGTFGPAVTRLFADRIVELHERCHPPLSRIKVGQVLWLAVAANDPPSRKKRIEDTRLVPVLLDLVTSKDIDDAIDTGKRIQTRCAKIVRLFEQAHAQGAVLSEADAALMMHLDAKTISLIILEYEKTTNQTVPRRGTVHDMGRSVSHKAIICYKRLVEKKPTSQVAQETFHCVEEVEYYVQCFRRVQLCHQHHHPPEEIATITKFSLFLVQEYLNLIELFALPSEPDLGKKDDVQSKPK